jgi:hypothetical protein
VARNPFADSAVAIIPNVIPTAGSSGSRHVFFLLHAKSAVSSLSDRSHLVHRMREIAEVKLAM